MGEGGVVRGGKGGKVLEGGRLRGGGGLRKGFVIEMDPLDGEGYGLYYCIIKWEEVGVSSFICQGEERDCKGWGSIPSVLGRRGQW